MKKEKNKFIENAKTFGLNLKVDKSLDKYSNDRPPKMEEFEKIMANSNLSSLVSSFK